MIDIANPAVPQQAGWFPQPVEQVATEDPALSGGANKVVMWSYPIIKGGLIYAVDIRNSLATRERASEEIALVRFLEGNSIIGFILRKH